MQECGESAVVGSEADPDLESGNHCFVASRNWFALFLWKTTGGMYPA